MSHSGNLFFTGLMVFAISSASDPAAAAQDVAAQLRDLQSAVESLRSELADARRESDQLRRDLQTLRDQMAGGPSQTGNLTQGADAEDLELLAAKVGDLELSKVESGSKYHVRLSGLALLQGGLTQGEVDSVDLPRVARPAVPGRSGGSISGGVRQSYVRLEVFAPRVGGVRTTGEVTFDFFGGYPITTEGFTSGVARLRTSTITFDWDHTRIVAGQEAPFFSPASPTSLLTSAYPALWSAGNMWSWIPQVHVEHFALRRGADTVVLQGGILDPLTGEPPVSEYERAPTAGERSRRPAVAGRAAWQRLTAERTTRFGAGAYYSQQAWGFERTVNAWAATADWNMPIGPWLAVSGELYRGRAIAGLGAGASPSVAFAGRQDSSTSEVRPFNSTGGWSQVKLVPLQTLELNAAFGSDRSAPAGTLQLWRAGFIDASTVRRNTSAFINGIYRVRSNLLFSIEYRRLRSVTFGGATYTAGHLSVGGGVGF